MVRTVVRALRAALKTRTRPPAAPRSRSGDAHFGDGSWGGSSLRLLADVSGATWRACRAHAPPPCPHITWIARAAPVFLCGSADAAHAKRAGQGGLRELKPCANPAHLGSGHARTIAMHALARPPRAPARTWT